jgi:hypothetical protein
MFAAGMAVGAHAFPFLAVCNNFTRTANDIVNATIPPVRTLKLYCCPSGCSTLHSHGRACPCIDQAYACMLHVASPNLYRKCQYFICVYIKYQMQLKGFPFSSLFDSQTTKHPEQFERMVHNIPSKMEYDIPSKNIPSMVTTSADISAPEVRPVIRCLTAEKEICWTSVLLQVLVCMSATADHLCEEFLAYNA